MIGRVLLSEPVHTILSALRDPGFRDGLAFGLLALPVGALAGLAARRPGRVAARIGGLCFVAASGSALARTEGLTDGLVVGLVALVVAGALSAFVPRSSSRVVVGALLAVPGAWIVVHAEGMPEIGWIRGLLGVGIVLGAALASDLDRRWRDIGAGPVLMAISVLGVYATVPDTEQALVLLGASLPLALPGLIGSPSSLSSLGPAGAFGAVGLLAWVVGVGGAARTSAIVGGLACLGLFVVEPVAHASTREPARVLADLHRGRLHELAILSAAQLVLVYVCSRVAGLRETAAGAAWIAGAALVLGVVALALGGVALRRALRTEGARA